MYSKEIYWGDRLDQLIQQKHMLSHPFYQAWTRGHLTLTTLQEYAQEYYHHVKAFPTYLSMLHSRCEDQEMRKVILHNLIDEEAGSPNHPDLWRTFILALGVDPEQIKSHQPRHATIDLINTFKENCLSQPLVVGLASLYCYESQIPAICTTKIEGLKKWYGINNPKHFYYFSVHETADIEHSAAERKLLNNLVKNENEEAVLRGAERTLSSLETFLSSFLSR